MFNKFTTSLSIILCILLVGINWKIKGAQKTNLNYQKICFDRQKDSLETLVVGHCEAQGALNPHYISEKTFNLAHQFQHSGFTSQILESEIGSLKNLKTLILGFTPLGFYSRHRSPSLYLNQVYREFDVLPKETDELLDFAKTLFTISFDEEVSGYGSVTDNSDVVQKEDYSAQYDKYEEDRSPVIYCNGYQSVFKTIKTEFHDEIFEEYDFSRPHYFQENLEKIMRLKEMSNKVVILFVPPWIEGLKEKLFKKIPRMKGYDDVYKKMISDYPNVNIWDFSDSELFGRDDFWEPTILNSRGSEKFSKIFKVLIDHPNSSRKMIMMGKDIDKVWLESKSNEK